MISPNGGKCASGAGLLIPGETLLPAIVVGAGNKKLTSLTVTVEALKCLDFARANHQTC